MSLHNKLSWYFKRLSTMSLSEISYRFHKFSRNTLENRSKGKPLLRINYKDKGQLLYTKYLKKKESQLTVNIFDTFIVLNDKINWHYDSYSNKEFPKIFSPKINTRGFNNMSAKYTWEINRHNFLPQLALNYYSTNDDKYLKLLITIIQSWVEQNPYMIGVNWYSNIELSIRLINWAITWEIIQASDLIKKSADFKEFVETIWLPLINQHCEKICKTLSKFSSANNHLVAEYAGLFIASTQWDLPNSNKWKKLGKNGLEKELLKQHSQNGVNKEEASGYIQFITDFFLISYIYGEKARDLFSPTYKNVLYKIFDYILNLSDINGNITRYGDDDDGHVLYIDNESIDFNFKSLLLTGAIMFKSKKFKSKALDKIDNRNLLFFGDIGEGILTNIKDEITPLKSSYYPDEGHFILRKQSSSKEIYMHFDCAPLGYLSIAAHGHADSLSFTLTIDGKPVLVDPGTYTYHNDEKIRRYFKGTLAHNTIRVDEKEQADYGGPSLWRNHFRSFVLSYETNDRLDRILGYHNGYEALGVEHRRELIFDKEKEYIELTDILALNDDKSHTLEQCFHFHPDIELKKNENEFETQISSSRKVVFTIDKQLSPNVLNGSKDPYAGYFSPRFRKIQPSPLIYSKLLMDKTIKLKTNIQIFTL